MITDLTDFCISPERTLLDAMRYIDRNRKGIALVVDAAGRLLYTMTDGDLRRAVLHQMKLDTTIAAWAGARKERGNLGPKSAPLGSSLAAIAELMRPDGLRHMPIVDDQQRVVGLVLSKDLAEPASLDLQAVVMAGGRGNRLLPLTAETPKPLLPVGDRPLMEHIVEQLRDAGIRRVSVTTHYRAEQIVSHFGDGQRFGLDVEYVNEHEPLGTAGGLGLLPPWTSTLLVVNGDVLTRVNYQSMLTFHRENRAVMTVGVRQYDLPVAYGVVETEGVEVRRIDEKPTLTFFMNGGVYMLEPSARDYLKRDTPLDMPDLIKALISDGRRVVSFPISEYWLDIGQQDDYRQAQVDINNPTMFDRG